MNFGLWRCARDTHTHTRRHANIWTVKNDQLNVLRNVEPYGWCGAATLCFLKAEWNRRWWWMESTQNTRKLTKNTCRWRPTYAGQVKHTNTLQRICLFVGRYGIVQRHRIQTYVFVNWTTHATMMKQHMLQHDEYIILLFSSLSNQNKSNIACCASCCFSNLFNAQNEQQKIQQLRTNNNNKIN